MLLYASLPGVLFHFNIRFLSVLYLIAALTIVYFACRREGHALQGVLTVLIPAGSPLLRFYILSIQTFPFLFILALILFCLYRGKIPAAALLSGLELATRRIFWLFFVVLAVWAVKEKKANNRTIGSLIIGLLMEFSPALFYPRSFFLNQIQVFKHFGTHLQNNLFGEHSLGFAYRLFDFKNFSLFLLGALLLGIFFLEIKKARLENLWIFLFLTCVVFLYFTQQVRPDEYYFLPLLLILALPIQPDSSSANYRLRTPWLFCIPLVFLLLTVFSFPFLSNSNGTLTPVDRNLKIQDASYVLPRGSAEFSLTGLYRCLKDKSLRFHVRTMEPGESPGQIEIKINDRDAKMNTTGKKRILIELPLADSNEHLYTGSNSITFSAGNPVPLRLIIRRE